MADGPSESGERGLFLVHLNRGKELLEARRYADAEAQLEEAYFLRPRDPAVLNLLGLVYFRQQKLEKAEEVYRKLLLQNPEEPTLSYNLGVVYLKLGRLEEAETSLLKALDQSRSNPRISFYLGTVYERQRRFQDAIFHYRRAGASAMVRRVEDKLAAAKPAPAPAAAPAAPPPAQHKKKDDTAEFRAAELRRELAAQPPPDGNLLQDLGPPEPQLVPAKVVGPVSPTLLAPEVDLPAPPAPPRERERPAVDAAPLPLAPAAGPLPLPGQAAETFRFLEPHLMEVDFSGKVFIKQGTIYSYSGELTFWVKERRAGSTPPLVIITGRGRLLLTDHERDITLMPVDDETVYVEPAHLLACEETLTPRYVRIGEGSRGPLEFVQLEGRGKIALSVHGRPLPLEVTPELPVSVPAPSIIMWSGALTPRAVVDPQIYEVIHPAGTNPVSLLRLEGRGRVLMEQAGAAQ
jgi:uncharacterized protein (AIM24 family)